MERTPLDASRILLLLTPVLLLQLGLLVAALRDLARRKNTRGPRWVWILVIVFGNLLGPVLYFLVGRKEE